MRCKGCNTLLQDDELKMIDPLTEDNVELCRTCLGHADDALLDDSPNLGFFQHDSDWEDDDYRDD